VDQGRVWAVCSASRGEQFGELRADGVRENAVSFHAEMEEVWGDVAVENS
jgi:hypothetical protein